MQLFDEIGSTTLCHSDRHILHRCGSAELHIDVTIRDHAFPHPPQLEKKSLIGGGQKDEP